MKPTAKSKLTPQQMEERRFRAIAALKRGLSEKEVAELLATSVASVNLWKRRFHKGGLEQLSAGVQGRPRRSALRLDGIEKVVDTLFVRAPESIGLAPGLWDWRAVRTLVERACGLDMSRWTVLRHLSEWGLSAPPILAAARRGSSGEDVERWLERAYPPIKSAARRAGGIVYFVETTAVVRPGPDDGASENFDVFWTLRPRGEAAFMIYPAPATASDRSDFLDRLATASPTPAYAIVSDDAPYREAHVEAWLRRAHDRVRLRAFQSDTEIPPL